MQSQIITASITLFQMNVIAQQSIRFKTTIQTAGTYAVAYKSMNYVINPQMNGKNEHNKKVSRNKNNKCVRKPYE